MIIAKTLLKQIEAGLDHADWYIHANRRLSDVAYSLDTTPEKLALVLAALSPRVQVARSVRMSFHFLKTGECHPSTMQGVRTSLFNGLKNGRLTGPKTENFRRAILGDGDALTLDVWTCRGLNVDQKKAYQKSVFPAVERLFKRASRATGLSVAQCQAAQWAGTMRTYGRKTIPLLFDGVKI